MLWTEVAVGGQSRWSMSERWALADPIWRLDSENSSRPSPDILRPNQLIFHWKRRLPRSERNYPSSLRRRLLALLKYSGPLRSGED